jgi:hypothetical protein
MEQLCWARDITVNHFLEDMEQLCWARDITVNHFLEDPWFSSSQCCEVASPKWSLSVKALVKTRPMQGDHGAGRPHAGESELSVRSEGTACSRCCLSRDLESRVKRGKGALGGGHLSQHVKTPWGRREHRSARDGGEDSARKSLLWLVFIGSFGLQAGSRLESRSGEEVAGTVHIKWQCHGRLGLGLRCGQWCP